MRPSIVGRRSVINTPSGSETLTVLPKMIHLAWQYLQVDALIP